MKAVISREQQLQNWINQDTEFECQSLQMVSGDASFRRYFRFLSGQQWIIAVDAPPEFEDCGRFIEVAKSYLAAGVPVPQGYTANRSLGFYCQQDLGSKQFDTQLTPDNCEKLYAQALSCIPAIQTCTATAKGDLPLYDDVFVQRELGLFNHWLLGEFLALKVTPDERLMLARTFELVTAEFLSQPKVGVHRDFHSRNLMLLQDEQIGVIDFQDAVIGPITYDAVSLLRDCYVYWPPEQVVEWLKNWHRKFYAQYDWPQFKRWFDMAGMQRHIKVGGIFSRLSIRDGKSAFLQDIPLALKYLINVSGQYPEHQAFTDFVENRVLPSVLAKLTEHTHVD